MFFEKLWVNVECSSLPSIVILISTSFSVSNKIKAVRGEFPYGFNITLGEFFTKPMFDTAEQD